MLPACWAAPADTQTLVSVVVLCQGGPDAPLEERRRQEAVIVRSKHWRPAATTAHAIRFDENAAVIVLAKKPQGYSYRWTVARELRDASYYQDA